MVVFGAGASYDSCATHFPPPLGGNEEYRFSRLPLGDALFEERPLFSPILERFPRALDVAQRLRLLTRGQTVESVMEELRAQAETDPRRYKQLAAIRYYLQLAISECEN